MDFKRLSRKIKKNKYCKKLSNFNIFDYNSIHQLFDKMNDIYNSLHLSIDNTKTK